MNQTRQKLNQIGCQILANSRNEIYLSMRFMDIALSMLSYEMNLSTTTVGIDGMKILFNPRHLIDLFRESSTLVNRAYMHMILHGIFGHVYGLGQRNEEYWNLACDIAVASILDEMPAASVRGEIPDFHREVFDNLRKDIKVLNAESIYKVIYNTPISGQQLQMLKEAFIVDDHQFWHNENQDDNDSSNQQRQQQNKEQWEKMSEQIQTGMETFQKEYGEDAGNLLYQLQIHHRERYNLREFLRKFAVLKEDIQTDDDSFDYIFYTYGLQLYENMPLIEPLEYKEVKKIEDFAIVIDTSQSCKPEIVKAFLTEVYSILKDSESFFRKVNIRLLQCDVAVTKDIRLQNAEALEKYMQSFEVFGGGGTDFRPAFEYISQLQSDGELRNLKGMLYFTDGYGQFPAKAPAYDVAFVFVNDEDANIKVPGWAMKVVLGSDDLQ